MNPIQKGKQMKKLFGTALLACICAGVGLVYAQTKNEPAAAPASGVSEALKQIEHEWAGAMKAGDADKLSQYLADDWAAIGPNGTKVSKKDYLADLKSGASKVESFEMGPMDVKVMGNVGVVQGSDTEKSTINGKDSSGKYVWMDVFAKRGGKWVVVRSQMSMVK